LRAGREPVAMWPLLVWAFKREMVRFSCGSMFRPRRVSQSSMAWAMAAGRSGDRGGADSGHDFAPCCHVDALEVYSSVLLVIDAEIDGAGRRKAFELLIKHAELAAIPTWNPLLPDAQLVPARRPNGKVEHLYGKRHEPVACMLMLEGYIEADKQVICETARARYSEWCRLMGEVIHMLGAGCPGLTRWRVKALGVEPSPWSVSLNSPS
jgi:hypothetical protein